MRSFVRQLIAPSLVLGALLFGEAFAQSNKVGYVDMKRLLDNAPQVQEGRQKLKAEFNLRDQQLNLEETRLAELKDREKREAGILPKAASDALRREIGALERSIQRTRKKLADELKARTDEELNRRWPQINEAVIAYAREQGYDLIVPAPVLFANPRIDITEPVLERLRAEAKASQSP